MGMSIEEAIKEIESITVVTDEKQALAFALAVHTMKKYQMIQADYENRLKIDMVALLEEIDLEMSEHFFGIQTEPWEVVAELRKKIIQQKINALKAEMEDQE